MNKQYIYKLINAFLNENATHEEKLILKKFLDSYQSDDFEWKEEYGSREEIEQRLYNNIQKKIKEEVKAKHLKKEKLYILFKYAASLILLLGLSFFIKNQFFNSSSIGDDIPSDQIILKLSDGTTKIINTTEQNTFVNKKGNVLGVQFQDKITYANADVNEANEKLIYNELYVPYGKKFQIELFDGTEVTLNSGSSLKYPVKFLQNQSREVFLEGEAYFDVETNEEQLFKVHTNTLVTQVYGTEFNISSYKNEETQEVVLVEGSVGVTHNKSTLKSQVILKPNQKAAISILDETIYAQEVDVENYTAWRNNVLLFSNLKFENILKKLERHYNVKIDNQYLSINNNRYTGTFETETIEQVLNSLNKIKPFSFEMNENEITIYP